MPSVDTIVAVATPPGRGGVGILRLSGPRSHEIASQLYLKPIVPRAVQHGFFYGNEGEVIDEGLLLYFKAPHSFTGEDVIELQVHGSPIVLDRLLQECVRLQARLAKPGEFSERAFLNDKMDLTQAEAIADLIAAHSEKAARMAVRSLQGDFSNAIHALNEKLIHLRLYVEASIDFSDEEIDVLTDGKITSMLEEALVTLTDIRARAHQGAMLREGLSVVIAGPPNAGKSTLMNRLAEREVAIVTDIAGTTRDVMREQVLIDDLPIHLIDTAGLRDSDDVVEKEGIKRAWDEVRRADCVLILMDIQHSKDAWVDWHDRVYDAILPHVPMIHVFNKIDALGETARIEKDVVYLSARSGEGLALLKTRIKDVVGYQPAEGQFLARRRHMDALDMAKTILLDGQKQWISHPALELLADDLRKAHLSLCEITGEFSSDDLLGKIFSSFCIGK